MKWSGEFLLNIMTVLKEYISTNNSNKNGLRNKDFYKDHARDLQVSFV